ncbi:uncharacterized protein [Antedon mediterranea]|uniref:uncharacterized protein n=1 Tax=Antedon mediterranea TaxID=105859 RepID=UPI003AF52EF1
MNHCDFEFKDMTPVFQDIPFKPEGVVNLRAFTLAMYIYPHASSSGWFLSTGIDNTVFRIGFSLVEKRGRPFNSGVKVGDRGKLLVRGHVLSPFIWTFVAVTFDGNERKITLWSDGEIVSEQSTTFNSMDMSLETLRIGNDDGYFFAKVAMLQVYEKALNESEMKAARDMPFQKWKYDSNAAFMKLKPPTGFTGTEIYNSAKSSKVFCAWKCLEQTCCNALTVHRKNNLCVLFSKFNVTNMSVSSDVDYYLKKSHQFYDIVNYC